MSARREKEQTDLELLKVTLKRKEKGERRFTEFNKFILRYETAMRGYAWRFLKNAALAEDALQEAKLKMFTFGLQAQNPKAYYRQVVKTCSLDVRTREFKHAHISIGPRLDGDERTPVEFEAGPECRPDVRLALSQKDAGTAPVLQEVLQRLVKKSPRKMRTARVLILRYFGKMDVKDIAKKLRISTPNAVSQIISRGLCELGKIISNMKKEGYPGVELLLESGEWA